MTTQMRGFGAEEPVYEQAIHAFSGGFMHRGDACGLLTGAALAAGFEAKRRFGDEGTASAAALHATARLAAALPELAGSGAPGARRSLAAGSPRWPTTPYSSSREAAGR